MIRQYVAALAPEKGASLNQSDAYSLYAALLETLSPEASCSLHKGESMISQYLTPCAGRCEFLWTVNLIGESSIDLCAPALESLAMLELRSGGISVTARDAGRLQIDSLSSMSAMLGGDPSCQRFVLRFLSPCAFRSGGDYVNFPSVQHILGSLLKKWNAAFPDSYMEDEDAMSMLTAGVKITGYSLSGASFRIKGVSIPSFSGTATLSARLSPQMLQLLRALLSFAPFCGIGIKTTLGMGGVSVKESTRPANGRHIT